MQDVSVVDHQEPLTADKIKAQVALIQDVMKSVMKDGEHYGVIPGCGKKPSLLKPGAEKLSMTFRLRPIMDNDRDIRITELPNGHREVHVYCHIVNAAGQELATGIGSCSTMESKYRYRGGEKIFTGRPVPTEYWNTKKTDPSKALESIGGKGYGTAKNPDTQAWEIIEFGEKMENPDLADCYNTILKMGKKRAFVDGILAATGASDIFTQDIEDMNPEDLKTTGAAASTSAKPHVDSPTASDGKHVDIISLSQGKVGDVLNVKGYALGVKHRTVGEKNSDITDFIIGDLPKDPTLKLEISVWGKHDQGMGQPVKFDKVKIEEFKQKIKYMAQGVSNG